MATTYPTYLTGMRLTADLITSSQPLFVRKVADTSRISTTTTSADPELLIASLPAQRYYAVIGVVSYNGDTTADMKGGLYGPTNATYIGAYRSAPSTVAATATTIVANTIGLGNGFAFGCMGTGTDMNCLFVGTYYSGDGGTFGFTWAQNSSVATNTTVKSGSYFVLTPVA